MRRLLRRLGNWGHDRQTDIAAAYRDWKEECAAFGRDERLNPHLTPERVRRHLIGVTLTFVLTWWYMPAWNLQWALIALAVYTYLSATLFRRERQEKARRAAKHSLQLPPGIPKKYEFFLLPALGRSDNKILAIRSRHPSTRIPRLLAMVLVLAAIVYSFNATMPGPKIVIAVFGIYGVGCWYWYQSWLRCFVIVTEDRVILVKDPPAPFHDQGDSWTYKLISSIGDDKPWWSGLLFGRRMAVRVKFRTSAGEIVLPFTDDGAELLTDMVDAEAEYSGKGPKADAKKERARLEAMFMLKVGFMRGDLTVEDVTAVYGPDTAAEWQLERLTRGRRRPDGQ